MIVNNMIVIQLNLYKKTESWYAFKDIKLILLIWNI